jgi:hypothetical protein
MAASREQNKMTAAFNSGCCFFTFQTEIWLFSWKNLILPHQLHE